MALNSKQTNIYIVPEPFLNNTCSVLEKNLSTNSYLSANLSVSMGLSNRRNYENL